MMQLRKNRRYTSTMYLSKGSSSNNDINILLLGEFKSFGKFEYEQISSNYTVHIVHEGSGIFSYNGKNYKLRQGDIFAFFPGMRVHYYDFKDSPWLYHWISFEGNQVGKLLGRAGLSRESPFRSLSKHPEFEFFLADLKKKLISKKYSSFYTTKIAWEFLDLIASDDRDKTIPLVNQVKRYIDSCEMHVPSVAGLSEHFNIDRSNLYRLFKSEFNLSVKEYIDLKRMKRGCELLKESSLNLRRIAEVCGYANEQYFSIAFKKKFSIPPGEWRNQHKKTLI